MPRKLFNMRFFLRMGDSAHKPEAQPIQFDQKIGLIDVGSGTIRLVVYGVTSKNQIKMLFTDKANCALGESIANNRKLDESAQRCAIDSIARFKDDAKEQGIEPPKAFATAAVREAKNKKAFLKAVKAETGTSINVISGKEEAKYQAVGASLGIKHTKDHISADLGRASLDVAIIKTVPRHPKSVLLGSAIVAAQNGRAAQYIHDELGKLPHYPTGRKLHLVGGSWRRMARAYLIDQGYKNPQDVLHGHSVEPAKFMAFVDQLATLSPQALLENFEIEGARLKHLPAAIETLRAFSERYESSDFVFSLFGAREGYLLSEIMNKKAKDVEVLPSSLTHEEPSLAAE